MTSSLLREAQENRERVDMARLSVPWWGKLAGRRRWMITDARAPAGALHGSMVSQPEQTCGLFDLLEEEDPSPGCVLTDEPADDRSKA